MSKKKEYFMRMKFDMSYILRNNQNIEPADILTIDWYDISDIKSINSIYTTNILYGKNECIEVMDKQINLVIKNLNKIGYSLMANIQYKINKVSDNTEVYRWDYTLVWYNGSEEYSISFDVIEIDSNFNIISKYRQLEQLCDELELDYTKLFYGYRETIK